MITAFETDKGEKFEVNEFNKTARPVGGEWAPYTTLMAHTGQRVIINWSHSPAFLSKGTVTVTR